MDANGCLLFLLERLRYLQLKIIAACIVKLRYSTVPHKMEEAAKGFEGEFFAVLWRGSIVALFCVIFQLFAVF